MPAIFVSANNAISFTQSATQIANKKLSTSDVIFFSQDAASNLKIKSCIENLLLIQNVIVKQIILDSTFDIVQFNQVAKVGGNLSSSLIHTLNINSVATHTFKITNAVNTLNLSQSVIVKGPLNVKTESNITLPLEIDLSIIDISDPDAVAALFATVGLRQTVAVIISVNKTATSFISFSQSTGPTKYGIASNHINLSDIARDVLFEASANVLQLTQSISVAKTKPATSALSLTQTIVYRGVLPRSITDLLDLRNIVTFYRIKDICVYDPGVGAGPSAPSMVDPVIVKRTTIILSYPYPQSITEIELRNPVFDDTEQFEFRKINRKTRGGTLKIFRSSIWPKAQRLIYSFNIIKESEKQALLSFMQQSIGKEIGLLDYESRQWRGILITPTTQITEDGRSGSNITIEFEGTIDPGGLSAAIKGTSKISPNINWFGPGLYSNINSSVNVTANLMRD